MSVVNRRRGQTVPRTDCLRVILCVLGCGITAVHERTRRRRACELQTTFNSFRKASDKKRRIAVVRHGEYYQPHPRRDIFALRDAGFDVDIFCDSEEGKPHKESIDGVTVFRLPIRHKRGRMGRYMFEYVAFPLLAAGALALR